jgi:hypothetical protein
MSKFGNKGSEYESKAAQDLKSSSLLDDPTSLANREKLRQKDEAEQLHITAYNKGIFAAHLDNRFLNKYFVGNSIIIKLEIMNWLIPNKAGQLTLNPNWSVGMKSPDSPSGKFIRNPLPYSFRGVVVAISDEVEKYRRENGLKALLPGDFVELNWFEIQNHRYYPDKHLIDHLTMDSPVAPNYEGYVKVPAQFIETFCSAGSFEDVYGTKPEDFYKMPDMSLLSETREIEMGTFIKKATGVNPNEHRATKNPNNRN